MNDYFTQLVRAGQQRWGNPKLTRDGGAQDAVWTVESGARVEASRSRASVAITFTTPFYARALTDRGE